MQHQEVLIPIEVTLLMGGRGAGGGEKKKKEEKRKLLFLQKLHIKSVMLNPIYDSAELGLAQAALNSIQCGI